MSKDAVNQAHVYAILPSIGTKSLRLSCITIVIVTERRQVKIKSNITSPKQLAERAKLHNVKEHER